jgi:hypothetical protein
MWTDHPKPLNRLLLLLIVALPVGQVGCSSESSGGTGATGPIPTAPSAISSITPSARPSTSVGTFLGSPNHGLQLTPVVGTGSGIVNITYTADGPEAVGGQIEVNVHGVPPNTLLYVRQSVDVGLPGAPGGQQSDGICQRAGLGLFIPVVLSTGGPPATIQTSASGAGAVHAEFHLNNPFLPEGAFSDLVFRLVDALPPAVPTIDLRTACFTGGPFK